jgi:transposase-like protein
MNAKIKCPKCNSKMELIGVTDKGAWKYYCKSCHTIIEVFKNAESNI